MQPLVYSLSNVLRMLWSSIVDLAISSLIHPKLFGYYARRVVFLYLGSLNELVNITIEWSDDKSKQVSAFHFVMSVDQYVGSPIDKFYKLFDVIALRSSLPFGVVNLELHVRYFAL